MAEPISSKSFVRFRLLSVGVEQYSSQPLTEASWVPTDIDASYTFELSAPERRIATIPRFAFRGVDQREMAVLQPIVHFDILPEDWPQLAGPDNSIILPVYLLQHLAVIATGFARGVLYEKFRKEPGYEHVMLPVIPVIDYIQEPLTFEAAGSEQDM